MDEDWEFNFKATPFVIENLRFWNDCDGALSHRLSNLLSTSLENIGEIPLLSCPYTVKELQILNHQWMKIHYNSWEKAINYDLFNKIVQVQAFRLALSRHTYELFVGKKLPGGWKVDRKYYDLFIQSINKNPSLYNNKTFMTQIIAKAGISSIPSLAAEVSKIDYRVYLKDIEMCSTQMLIN